MYSFIHFFQWLIQFIFVWLSMCAFSYRVSVFLTESDSKKKVFKTKQQKNGGWFFNCVYIVFYKKSEFLIQDLQDPVDWEVWAEGDVS